MAWRGNGWWWWGRGEATVGTPPTPPRSLCVLSCNARATTTLRVGKTSTRDDGRRPRRWVRRTRAPQMSLPFARMGGEPPPPLFLSHLDWLVPVVQHKPRPPQVVRAPPRRVAGQGGGRTAPTRRGGRGRGGGGGRGGRVRGRHDDEEDRESARARACGGEKVRAHLVLFCGGVCLCRCFVGRRGFFSTQATPSLSLSHTHTHTHTLSHSTALTSRV